MELPIASRPTNRWQTFRALAHLPTLVRLYWRLFRDARVPLWPKALLVAGLGYVVLPFDFIPDMLPLIGFTDDAAVLVTAIKVVAAHVTPEHREAARALIARLREGASTQTI